MQRKRDDVEARERVVLGCYLPPRAMGSTRPAYLNEIDVYIEQGSTRVPVHIMQLKLVCSLSPSALIYTPCSTNLRIFHNPLANVHPLLRQRFHLKVVFHLSSRSSDPLKDNPDATLILEIWS